MLDPTTITPTALPSVRLAERLDLPEQAGALRAALRKNVRAWITELTREQGTGGPVAPGARGAVHPDTRERSHPDEHEVIELVWADTAAGDFEEVYARLEAAAV